MQKEVDLITQTSNKHDDGIKDYKYLYNGLQKSLLNFAHLHKL